MSGWKIQYLDKPQHKEITLAEFFDSIEANGLPQISGTYWHRGDYENRNNILAACAIGQSALNLGIEYRVLENIINTQFKTAGKRGLASSIEGRNDHMSPWSYKTIADYYRQKFAHRLNEKITVEVTFKVDKG